MQSFTGPSAKHLCATGNACPAYPVDDIERETRLCAECLRRALTKQLAEYTTDGVLSLNALYEVLESDQGLAIAEAVIDAQARRFPTMSVAKSLLLPVANDTKAQVDALKATIETLAIKASNR